MHSEWNMNNEVDWCCDPQQHNTATDSYKNNYMYAKFFFKIVQQVITTVHKNNYDMLIILN